MAILVLAFDHVTPRALDRVEYLTPASLRRLGDPTVLLVAPWLSPRARELIEQRGLGYLDLTGNVLVRAQQPTVYLRLHGLDADPRPAQAGTLKLGGPRINGLVRLLVDATPPYRARALAATAQLSESYVSRALRGLAEQGLVERRGSVVDVDWAELLRQRSGEYALRRDNRSRGFWVEKPSDLLLHARRDEVVVTGPCATGGLVGHDGLLELYVPDIRTFARSHALQPAGRAMAGSATTTGDAANVLLLQPASTSQVDRSRLVDGMRHAGFSQLVQDLLSGGFPEAGETLLDRMGQAMEWRLPLTSLAVAGSADLGV